MFLHFMDFCMTPAMGWSLPESFRVSFDIAIERVISNYTKEIKKTIHILQREKSYLH